MPGPYRYDEASGRYRSAITGRFVAWSTVRDALDGAIDASGEAMRALGQQLREGNVSLEQFRSSMMEEIKQAHLAAVALGKGGHAQLTQADFGRAGGVVAREFTYLERMVQQVASGEQPLDGRFLQRVDQYTKAPRETFHRQQKAERAKRGDVQMRSVLNPADHCDDCVRIEALGWVSVTDPPAGWLDIGQRQCRHNCKCDLEFQSAEAA